MTSVADATVDPLRVAGSVAVVTGGASGIGKAIARALLERGGAVVLADIEDPVLTAAVRELSPIGPVSGMQTDVTDEASTAALADHVFNAFGRCELLFLNAGVTSGGGGLPWQQEPNDWRWCFGVNAIGVGIGVSTFVPRMIESGRPGQVILTSSKDGGIAPVATASVYAASKAAVTCFAEALHHNLVAQETALRASVFYPSGGLMDTGLYTAARNRPAELQREGAGTGRTGMTFQELKDRVAAATGKEPAVADLDELGELVADGIEQRRFIIAREMEQSAELLHERADAIARCEVPPQSRLRV